MKTLKISETLSLPLDVTTSRAAWLGTTGSGKTYGAMKMAECMLDVGAQLIAIDPVGVWYGLRIGADGKSAGYTIPVFGGLHGDLPLEVESGAYIADLIIDHNLSVVLDVSQFEHDTDKTKFCTAFAKRFFFRKKSSPSAVHVFLEECQEFVPQDPARGEERMLHEFVRISKIGRNFGIGVSLISQRPQEVNKKALNLTKVMFAFQMTGPHERKAVKEWIGDKGLDMSLLERLPHLENGKPHIWVPEKHISGEHRISLKKTMNVSSTPEVGKIAAKMTLAPVDLEKIKKEMTETIERAKADDPVELRKKIASLELERNRFREESRNTVDANALDEQVSEAYGKGYNEGFSVAAEDFGVRLKEFLPRMAAACSTVVDSHADDFRSMMSKLQEELTDEIKGAPIDDIINAVLGNPATPPVFPKSVHVPQLKANVKSLVRAIQRGTGISPVNLGAAPRKEESNGKTSGAQYNGEALPRLAQKILDSLAELEAIGRKTPKRVVVAGAMGNSLNGHVRNNMGWLNARGLVQYPDSDSLQLTSEGKKLAARVSTPLGRTELFERSLRFLSSLEQRLFTVIYRSYPREISREAVANALGVTLNGHIRNNLGGLRSKELIVYPSSDTVKCSDWLFI